MKITKEVSVVALLAWGLLQGLAAAQCDMLSSKMSEIKNMTVDHWESQLQHFQEMEKHAEADALRKDIEELNRLSGNSRSQIYARFVEQCYLLTSGIDDIQSRLAKLTQHQKQYYQAMQEHDTCLHTKLQLLRQCYAIDERSSLLGAQKVLAETGCTCGTQFMGSGYIQSPLYPRRYLNNINCTWTLRGTNNRAPIVLTFRNFSTESIYDFLLIEDSRGFQSLYSGDILPPTCVLGSSAAITFITDRSVTATGFYIEFKSFMRTNASVNEVCQNPFVLRNSSCYWFSNIAQNWTNAQGTCRFLGGNLVEIEDMDEDDFLNRQMLLHNMITAWIGLVREPQTQNFRWQSGKSAAFTNWIVGEPSDKNNKEDCGEIRQLINESDCNLHYIAVVRNCSTNIAMRHRWNDRHCRVKTPFICEI